MIGKKIIHLQQEWKWSVGDNEQLTSSISSIVGINFSLEPV
jgi:hypothetical protein